jgi:hypothetical protein
MKPESKPAAKPKSKSQTVSDSRRAKAVLEGPLTQQQVVRYAALKKRLSDRLNMISACFVEVGQILKTVKAERLYRQEYGSFEEFTRAVIGKGRRYLNQIIAAETLVEKMLEAGAALDEVPATERQARELLSVSEILGDYDTKEINAVYRRAKQLSLAAGKTQPDSITIRKAALEVSGSPEIRTRHADELVKKIEGVARALNVTVDFSLLDESQYLRLIAALKQIASLVNALAKSARGGTPARRQAKTTPTPKHEPDAPAPDPLKPTSFGIPAMEQALSRILFGQPAPAPTKTRKARKPNQTNQTK